MDTIYYWMMGIAALLAGIGQIAHEVEWAARGAAKVVPFGRVDGQPIRPAQVFGLIEEAARR